MTPAERLIGIVAATLPPGIRERHREEWLADLAGAPEAGITRSDVVLGAVSFTLTLARSDPAVSGMSRPDFAARRARWGLLFLGTGAVAALGLFMVGALAIRGEGRLGSIAVLATSFAGALVVLGFAILATAVIALLPLPASLVVTAVAVGGAVMVAALGTLVLVSTLVLVLMVLPVAVVGIGTLVVLIARGRPDPQRRIAEVSTAVAGAVAVGAILAIGFLHILVWNPLAKLPGLTLDEIYAGLAAAGETPSAGSLVLWSASAVISVIVLLLFAILPLRVVRTARSLRRVAALALAAVSGTALSVTMAGFGMGMGIADAFATSGGDAAMSGPALVGLGVVSGIAGWVIALTPAPRQLADVTA